MSSVAICAYDNTVQAWTAMASQAWLSQLLHLQQLATNKLKPISIPCLEA